ncbi:HvfX family Cu-binding RiPP maturation protein [Bermanella sp. WJH001]|uniref:HvfX family Cu-binding RiPP maturation protein n=1 Tax=Bermanella sp. WJH001 TaxID=3048005 RepID=UPI0032DFE141
MMMTFIKTLSNCMDNIEKLDFLPLLALRLYLAPVFWVAGMNKLSDIDSVASWFGNSDWGLGLPFPELLAWLATLTEVGAAVLLVIGLAVRWISIPLIITMLVAIFAVHWPNGWQAVADPNSPFASADIEEVMRRLGFAKDILQEHGNYNWLTERGSVVISNNGIEWATTYLLMCLVLLFKGAGRYVSLDYYVKLYLNSQK